MDTNELISRFSPLARRHWLPLSLGALGMIFFAYGLIGLFVANKTSSEDIIFEANADQNPAEEKIILVDIEGAVVKPGLYKLPLNSRIQDGLVAAGGVSAAADREYVAKNLNLATKLSDGAKIYIPSIGESVGNTGVLNVSSENIAGGLININTSSQTDLEVLSGVGPVTASKIISGRPYNSVDELLTKKVVGSKLFDQIKDRVTVF